MKKGDPEGNRGQVSYHRQSCPERLGVVVRPQGGSHRDNRVVGDQRSLRSVGSEQDGDRGVAQGVEVGLPARSEAQGLVSLGHVTGLVTESGPVDEDKPVVGVPEEVVLAEVVQTSRVGPTTSSPNRSAPTSLP